MPAIDSNLQAWLAKQHVFFVATAPLSREGHVNCSPKGGDSFRVIDESTVAYLDLTGSGVETIAHLKENGRIVIMFCAFEGPPKIVRLHGLGTAIEPQHPDFSKLTGLFSPKPGIRSVIRIKVSRVSNSCGFGVPLLDHTGDRDEMEVWATKKGPAGVAEYRAKKNRTSIDGLPGIDGLQ